MGYRGSPHIFKANGGPIWSSVISPRDEMLIILARNIQMPHAAIPPWSLVTFWEGGGRYSPQGTGHRSPYFVFAVTPVFQ